MRNLNYNQDELARQEASIQFRNLKLQEETRAERQARLDAENAKRVDTDKFIKQLYEQLSSSFSFDIFEYFLVNANKWLVKVNRKDEIIRPRPLPNLDASFDILSTVKVEDRGESFHQLSFEDVQEAYQKQSGRCAISGVELFIEPIPTHLAEKGYKKLYEMTRPILMRLDSSQPWSLNNMILVCAVYDEWLKGAISADNKKERIGNLYGLLYNVRSRGGDMKSVVRFKADYVDYPKSFLEV
jgi:hypothetical protein